MLGLFGAALLYGDGMITPAISVLSAVEGLKIATPLFDPYVVPIAVVILIGLFAIQRHGTASCRTTVRADDGGRGSSCMAMLGIVWLARRPSC